MSPGLRSVLLATATAGAAAFASYAGADLEAFDFMYEGLRTAGLKPRGQASAVVFLPYGIIPYAESLAFLSPAMASVAQRGFSVALVEYPDIQDYPDAAAAPFFPPAVPTRNIPGAVAAICAEWGYRANVTADAIKNGLCAQQGVDCSSIAVAGFSTGAGIAAAVSTYLPGTLNIAAQLSVAWGPLLGAGQIGPGDGPGQFSLPTLYHPCFVNGAPFSLSPGSPYSMTLNAVLAPDKRFSVISELDELFGNPPADEATSLPVFELQQLFSAFCESEGKKVACIQSSGAGYYVVPAGEITQVPGSSNHSSFSNVQDGFFAPGGKVWQAEAAFEWLLATAFDP
mmetsp:Transcript_10359/g.32826  ORF Transcript_10359/g.32826 Transcript_10359/m.32826 type:complete len:341 (-) Transcript_10359:203-1225(-)